MAAAHRPTLEDTHAGTLYGKSVELITRERMLQTAAGDDDTLTLTIEPEVGARDVRVMHIDRREF